MLVQLIPLPDGTPLTMADGINTLGRGEDCSIRIPHGTISAQHCLVQCAGGTVIVRDQHSTNNTRVNGRAIQRLALNDGDELQLGRLKYRVRISHETVPLTVGDGETEPGATFESAVPTNPRQTSKRKKARQRTEESPSIAEQPTMLVAAPSPTAEIRIPNETPASPPSAPSLAVPATTGGDDDAEFVSPAPARQLREPGPWAEWMQEQRGSLAIILVCVVIILGYYGLPWFAVGETSDRTFYDFYAVTLSQLEELASQSASESEWQSLQDEYAATNEKYVRELEKTASSRRPARQFLLFAGRDHLPKVFSSTAKERATALKKLEASLAEVQQMLDDPAGYLESLQEQSLLDESGSPLPSPGGR